MLLNHTSPDLISLLYLRCPAMKLLPFILPLNTVICLLLQRTDKGCGPERAVRFSTGPNWLCNTHFFNSCEGSLVLTDSCGEVALWCVYKTLHYTVVFKISSWVTGDTWGGTWGGKFHLDWISCFVYLGVSDEVQSLSWEMLGTVGDWTLDLDKIQQSF